MKFEFGDWQVGLLIQAVHNERQRIQADMKRFEETGMDKEYPKEYEEMKEMHDDLLELYYQLGGK